jgi:hypothetical protein
MPHTDADYSKHTDAELREGIRKAQEQLDRVRAEDSDDAVAANREQVELMQQELDRRGKAAT